MTNNSIKIIVTVHSDSDHKQRGLPLRNTIWYGKENQWQTKYHKISDYEKMFNYHYFNS